MPVGIQRLNARRTQPNPNIVFIKPLPGPDFSTAEKFLERIAAQCLPIMKEHHLSVVTLEEYEPNREFVGRNFNAGEVIQLVLKSVHAPHRWLPFRYVQMVMMHELAHCTHMHHARAFWAVRDAYAAAMTALWEKGYTGEGIWGRGATLDTGAWERDVVGEEEPLPAHLCGGTYRSRRGRGGRGRKRKPKRSWKEQKERRIAKKFGVNGMALGADEAEKVKLEGGKKVVGRPRVAGSARGRELRAAAALARFDKQKVEEDVKSQGEDEEGEETESDSEFEVYLEEEEEKDDAVDLDGKKMKDGDGGVMVKVCEDEDGNDPSARNERDELRSVFARPPGGFNAERDGGRKNGADAVRPRVKTEPESSSGRGRITQTDMLREVPRVTARPLRLHDIPHIRDAVPPPKPTLSTRKEAAPRPVAASLSSSSSSSSSRPTAATPNPTTRPAITIHRLAASPAPKRQRPAASAAAAAKKEEEEAAPLKENGDAAGAKTCPLCSLLNDAAALRCAACGNVLRADAVQGAWRCGGAACESTGYLNAADCGVCGLCGRRKP
ncbi:WLM domain-containing protein [Beauveria bassiana ARSEF 2860]|uniref:WLM domain-containing protein n=1 Tax=Beauveria bassiana (strain ARSEF 2860) TaxID=655819 RepID=J4KR89_BEAB2|nr:WLM domain-containing protein [Beauveria bassiana ARSEF 2860]EJP70534.1 WLM domain-containing protein [Beauveria bassiana ARSEF 2860]